MSSLEHWSDDVAVPALLGSAWRAYGMAIRRALTASGFDDMPARGSFVVGDIARNGPGSAADLPRAMGVSKQAVSQLLDALVTRGYLHRTPDAVDRRRRALSLTERGTAAAVTVRGAVESVDAALTGAVGADAVTGLRRTLAALLELRVEEPSP